MHRSVQTHTRTITDFSCHLPSGRVNGPFGSTAAFYEKVNTPNQKGDDIICLDLLLIKTCTPPKTNICAGEHTNSQTFYLPNRTHLFLCIRYDHETS